MVFLLKLIFTKKINVILHNIRAANSNDLDNKIFF